MQKLICLGLDRSPAYELIKGTAAAWFEGLTHNRQWDKERDTQRILDAFSVVIKTRKQWPTVADFLECLPAIVEKPALPVRVWTEADMEEGRVKMQAILKSILKNTGSE